MRLADELLELLGPEGAGDDDLPGGGQTHRHLLLPAHTQGLISTGLSHEVTQIIMLNTFKRYEDQHN